MKKTANKILSFVLSAILLILPLSVNASDNVTVNELTALSILPDGMGEGDLEKVVTRAEFAYIATRLIEREDFVETDTRFKDVDKSNEFSGYIEFLASLGILNGVTAEQFCPNDILSAKMACKIIIKILGYDVLAEERGGYPYGYIEVANELGLTSFGSSGDEVLTVRETCNLVYEVLTGEFPLLVYGELKGEAVSWASEGKFSLLQRLRISSYSGVIKDVAKDGKTALFEVTKNNYDTNYAPISKGEVVRFDVKNGIDAYEYENIPISVYVDENEKIISVTVNRRYEIMYTYITAVNGDTDKDAFYAPANMERFSLSDYEEDFDVTEDFSLSIAGNDVTTQSKITGSFAKIVLLDGDIYYIDAWPTEEGGIITEVGADSISYIYQDLGSKKLKELSSYENVFIYINGKRTDYDQLKKNSVFDYYAQGDTLMITCCEKVISDVLYTFSAEKAEIAGIYYRFDKLYYCIEENYVKLNTEVDSNFSKLLGKDVTAYFGPDGLLRYITKTNEIDTGEFYGVVLGANSETLSEDAEIKILKIYPQQETVVYKITEKTVWNDNLNMDILLSNRYEGGIFNGDGIFIFEKNAKDEIVKIKNPQYVKGFGDGPIKKTGITQIPNMGGGYVSLNGKPYFFQSSPIVAVFEEHEKQTAREVDWIKIYNRPVENATMVFFGRDIEKDPELVVLCGNLNKLGNNVITRGILIDKSQVLNANSDLAVELKVLTKSGSIEKYIVPTSMASDLPEYAIMSYYTSMMFSDSEIFITEHIDLSANPQSWQASTDGSSLTMQKGTVTAISDSRLCVENAGEVYVNCIHPSRCVIAEYDSTHPANRYKTIDISDVEIGDTVYYDLDAEGIEVIIAIH